MDSIKEKLITCFEDIGIFIDLSNDEDIDLRDYIIDSLQFISTIISIEENFGIEFPAELMLYDNLASLNAFCKMIEGIEQNSLITN